MARSNRLLRASISLALLPLAAAPQFAAAQQDPPALEEIVVTGSRIARRDLDTSGPLSTFTRDELEVSGRLSLGEILREIPSVAGAGQTTQINNGGAGANTISLRGLGSTRTLVLLNGRRLPNSTLSLAGEVDMNTIPVSMVERVEVLREGASAVYGSDAVAGVINIITRRDFSGFDLNAGYRETSEGDGETMEFSLTFGESFDRGHFIFDASYYDEQETSVAKRDWANVPKDYFFGPDQGFASGAFQFLGSSAPPWGNYNVPGLGPVTLGPDFAGGTIIAPNGQAYKPFDFFGGDSYNFAPINHARQPNQRWMLTFQGEREVDFLPDAMGDVRLIAEAQYINRTSQGAFAEEPLAPLIFYGYGGSPYSADNFYNPFGENIADWRRRLVEAGPRTDDRKVETKRIVLGLEGDVGRWNWDLTYQYGNASGTSRTNVINLERVANAVGPSLVDPETGAFVLDADGNPQCANDTLNCVPLNVFGENSITPEMLDYIQFITNEFAGASHNIWSFNLTNSELFDLPAGPLGIAVGAQYREERGFDFPDSQVQTLAVDNAVTGVPRFETSGSYDVKELYAEMLIPLLSDAPLAQSVELDLAHRFSDYSSFGTTNNSKIGLRWRMNEQVMVRGGFSQAFRAGQISQLFGGAGTSFPTLTDPCGTNPTPFCIADGVPPGGFTQPSQQISTQVGGNPEIQPEEADIFTAGIVYTPNWLEGLSFTIDYYNVELENAISGLGGDFILNSCANTGELCDLITRFGPDSGVEGAVSSIDNRLTNVGGVKTDGWDFGIAFRGLETGYGNFDFRVDASYISKYDKEVAGGQVIPHAGLFIDDQDGWFGRIKANVGVDWNIRDVRVAYLARYIHGAQETGEDLFFGNPFVRRISSATYHDLQFTYNLRNTGASFVLGVNNLFDRDPSESWTGFNDNTDVRTFDTMGRVMYARVRFSM